MDFSAWFEAYLGGRWYTFDARHNKPRIGRILMARGRDATDVAIVTSFGPCTLAGFKVITEEVTSAAPAGCRSRRDCEGHKAQDYPASSLNTDRFGLFGQFLQAEAHQCRDWRVLWCLS
jgi:hypothetical protein